MNYFFLSDASKKQKKKVKVKVVDNTYLMFEYQKAILASLCFLEQFIAENKGPSQKMSQIFFVRFKNTRNILHVNGGICFQTLYGWYSSSLRKKDSLFEWSNFWINRWIFKE